MNLIIMVYIFLIIATLISVRKGNSGPTNLTKWPNETPVGFIGYVFTHFIKGTMLKSDSLHISLALSRQNEQKPWWENGLHETALCSEIACES